MNNRIEYISKAEADYVRQKMLQDKQIFFAELYGKEAECEEDFMRQFFTAFCFPGGIIEEQLKIGWFHDYAEDLLWIKEPDIVLLVHDFEDLFKHDPQIKKMWLEELEMIILPWWEEGVVGHMVGGVTRNFVVYLEI